MIFTNIHMCIFDSTEYQVTVTKDDKYIVLQLVSDDDNPHASCLISIAEGALDDFIKKIMAMRTELEQKSIKAGMLR